MIEDIKKDVEKKTEFYDYNEKTFRNVDTVNHFTKEYILKSILFEILDKYNNQEKYKWKCDICGTGFNNFHAQGFDNQIYCPLCYYKKLYSDYKKAWKELKNDNTELIEYGNRAVKDPQLYKNKKMYLLEQKYNLGSETNERTN